jgi:ubiquinone/menaquinone biosynthesis C-methylase UbiE
MIADFTGTQREIILRYGVDGASSVLDVGCGDGEKTFYISPHVQWSVGIDPDENIVKIAMNKYHSNNLEFQVAQAESLPFSNSSFAAILFNQTLHHVPIEKQIKALKESHRVLQFKGRLLITEPIYGSGSFGQMWKLNDDDKKRKQNAINAIESVINTEFSLSLEREIHIEYHCEGFDDFYEYYAISKSDAKWEENKKQDIINKLEKCERSSDGNFILDYSASVWLLIKT